MRPVLSTSTKVCPGMVPPPIPQRITPYALATRLPGSESRGVWTPLAEPSLAHAWTESGEMLSNSTPRVWKSLLFCRSTTCCMQPAQVEPMLKYRSTASRPRNSPSETLPPWAEGRLNAGAGSPIWGPSSADGGDPAVPPPPQAADARPRRASAAARNDPRILIATPPAWSDVARTPRRRSRLGHSAPPGCGPVRRSGGGPAHGPRAEDDQRHEDQQAGEP